MEIHRSARKHGIADVDIVQAAAQNLVAYRIDDEPSRELRLGFDTGARRLEVVVLIFDDGDELVIPAMRARPTYLDLLPGEGEDR